MTAAFPYFPHFGKKIRSGAGMDATTILTQGGIVQSAFKGHEVNATLHNVFDGIMSDLLSSSNRRPILFYDKGMMTRG